MRLITPRFLGEEMEMQIGGDLHKLRMANPGSTVEFSQSQLCSELPGFRSRCCHQLCELGQDTVKSGQHLIGLL